MEGMGERRQFAWVTWGSVRAHPHWTVLEIVHVHDWHKITSGGKKGQVIKENTVFECRSNVDCREKKLVLQHEISAKLLNNLYKLGKFDSRVKPYYDIGNHEEINCLVITVEMNY